MSGEKGKLSDTNLSCEMLQDETSEDTEDSGIFGSCTFEENKPINKDHLKEKRDKSVDRTEQSSREIRANIPARTDADTFQKDDNQMEKGEILSELKPLLLDVVKTQSIILREIQTMKEDMKQLTLENTAILSEYRDVAMGLESRTQETIVKQRASVEKLLQNQKQECKGYTDSELRTLESKVNGLAAVLEHVQKRCLEREMEDEDDTEHESISSSESAEEEVQTAGPDRDEGLLPELIQEKRNRCWLRQNHIKLLSAINPQHDLLLHQLAQENILTQSDEEKILSHGTRKEQSRELLLRLRRCTCEQFKSFLRHLGSEHPLEVCATSVDDDTGEADDFPCVVCDVITLAQVDDVIDYVYQQDYIDGFTFESVMKMASARERWCRLLGDLADKTGGNEVLVKALSKKYPCISKRLAVSRQTSLSCCCSQAIST